MQRLSWRISPFSGKAPGTSPVRRCRFAGRVGAAAILHVLFVAAMAAVVLWRPAVLEDSLEGPLIDWHFRARNSYRPPAVPPGVVIVAIDEASVSHFGSWPWSRIRIAELIDKIGAGGPRAIGVGLLLHPPESTWGDLRVAAALAAVPGKTATAVELRVGPAFAGPVPERLLAGAISRIDRPERLIPPEASQALLPPPSIAAATVFGHAVYEGDGAGEVRRENLYLRYGGTLVPSLALQTARIAAGLPPESARVLEDGEVELGDTIVPGDRRGRLLVNYYGPEGTIRRYSAGSVLSVDTSPAVFADAVVFVGTTGIATFDLLDTPLGENLPAVEKDATVAANILTRDFLREAPRSANLVVLLVAGLAVPLLLRRRAILSLLCLLGAALALVTASFALFLAGVHLALAYPLLLLLAAGGAAILHQHLREVRVARRMRLLFSSYVTERVLERLIADPAMARPGGERREVTILFTDIRGFMGFSEKHRPEEVVRTLNEYLEAMTEVIFRWEGTLDKFIGDSILAFWGAPLPQEDHAERALRCALHLCARLEALNAGWAAAGRQELEMGVGITTGQVLVGNIGAAGKKMDYTVIGDQVNLCSRVEELTKDYRARILITAETFTRLRPLLAAGSLGHVSVEGLAAVAVKGKEEPVRLYRVSPLGHGEQTRVEESGTAAPDA